VWRFFLIDTMINNNSYFIKFNKEISNALIPEIFNYIQDEIPHPLCIEASHQLQDYLLTQQDWIHNFGLEKNNIEPSIGKMFGVLIVENKEKEIGFLVAFSGKLAGKNIHDLFVPAIYDALTEEGFLNTGMIELSKINERIATLYNIDNKENKVLINQLKSERKKHSNQLQKLLFDNYYFTNQYQEMKGVYELFPKTLYKNPPSGAGECAGPKLLQYAFQNEMKPLAIAEFWWGISPKSIKRKHKKYYACCEEKCTPILKHMMLGIATNLSI
jgi:tRNA pseudouridine32 synthase/23S rRNA pseudouridine746 synthase